MAFDTTTDDRPLRADGAHHGTTADVPADSEPGAEVASAGGNAATPDVPLPAPTRRVDEAGLPSISGVDVGEVQFEFALE